MKITLDIDQLLHEEKITQAEYEKFSAFAAKSTGSLAFNVLIGFGVIAVSLATLALVPSTATAIIIGLCILIFGLSLLRVGSQQWAVLTNISILVGSLMFGGGVLIFAKGSLTSILFISAIFAMASIFARSALLAVLATLVLSSAIGARTAYIHASYFLSLTAPLFTIILFSIFAVVLYQISKRVSHEYERIAVISARTSVFLVNLAFWIGSLWGENIESFGVIIPDTVFAIVWAIALIATAIWSWKKNRRWVLNTVVTFGGIHFYTQWFEHLGASAGTVLVAGLLALGFAIGLRNINKRMKNSE
ncbi:hypothetical protein [Sulfurimonas sp.]